MKTRKLLSVVLATSMLLGSVPMWGGGKAFAATSMNVSKLYDNINSGIQMNGIFLDDILNPVGVTTFSLNKATPYMSASPAHFNYILYNSANRLAKDDEGNIWVVGIIPGTEYGATKQGDYKKSTKLAGLKVAGLQEQLIVYAKEDNTIWAAGLNNYGERGDGTIVTTGSGATQATKQIILPDTSAVVDIKTNGVNTFILLASGDVYVSGQANNSGIPGLDAGTNITSFTKIPGLSNIKQFSAGDKGSAQVALDISGNIFVWGPSTPNPSVVSGKTKGPQQVMEVSNIVDISAGLTGYVVLDDQGVVSGSMNHVDNSLVLTHNRQVNKHIVADLLPEYIKDKIVDVTIYYATVVALTEKGNVYSWGMTSSGSSHLPSRVMNVGPDTPDYIPESTGIEVTALPGGMALIRWDQSPFFSRTRTLVNSSELYNNGYHLFNAPITAGKHDLKISEIFKMNNGTQIATKKDFSLDAIPKRTDMEFKLGAKKVKATDTFVEINKSIYRLIGDNLLLSSDPLKTSTGAVATEFWAYSTSSKIEESNFGNHFKAWVSGLSNAERDALVERDNSVFDWIDNQDEAPVKGAVVLPSVSERLIAEELYGPLATDYTAFTRDEAKNGRVYFSSSSSGISVRDTSSNNTSLAVKLAVNISEGTTFAGTGTSTNPFRITGVTEVPKVAMPTNLTVNTTETTITAKWDAVPGADMYVMKVGSDTVYQGPMTSFTAEGLQSNRPYPVYVYASTNQVLSDAATATAITKEEAKLPAPDQPIVSNKKPGAVTITWNKITSAILYKVFRNGTELATVGTESFTDKTAVAGSTYSYTVQSFDGTKTSQSSPFALVTVDDDSNIPDPELNLEKPLNLIAVPKSTSIKLNWDSVSSATQYTVKRGNSVVYQGPLTTFNDVELKEGTDYSYSVVASNEKASSEASTVSATTLVDQLAYPANFRIEKLEYNKVRLEWDAVEGADEYEISRDGKTIGVPMSTGWEDILEEGLTGTLTYRVAAVKNGVNGKVAIKVVNIPNKPVQGEAPKGDLVLKANRVYHDRVGLSWNTVTGATYYEVVQDGTNKVWTGSLNTITDGNVGPEETHTYKVIAANENGFLESNVIDVKTPAAPQNIVITPSQPMEGTITFDFKVVDGAVTYVERNPQTTYTPVGDGTYRKTYLNSATGETRDEGIVSPVNGKLNFSETGVDPNKNYHYDIVAVLKKADGTEEVVAKEEVSVNTPADGSGTTVPGTIVDPGNGGGTTPTDPGTGGGNTPTPNPGTGNGGGTTPTNPTTPGTGGSVTTPSPGGSAPSDTNGGSEGNGTVTVPGTVGGTDTEVSTEDETEPTTSPSFSDVDGSFAKEAILSLSANGIVKGYSDGTFGGKKKVTRAEFAIFLNRALGYTSSSPYAGTFKDFEAQAWYASELSSALENGITKGFNDNTYRPNAFIPREQAAVMLANVLMKNGSALSAAASYVDQENIVGWAKESVNLVTQEAVMSGYPGNKFMPKRELTREEAAELIYNLIKS